MLDIDINKTLQDNLPENVYRLYKSFETAYADNQMEQHVSQYPMNSVIEIGTGNGYSALVFAKYCDGIVFTFDVVRRNAELLWSFFPELRKKIYYITGSQEHIDETIRLIYTVGEQTLDFAFLDGEHTDKCLRHDYDLVKNIGIKRILFHDAEKPELAPLLYDELKAKRLEYLYAYLEVNQ